MFKHSLIAVPLLLLSGCLSPLASKTSTDDHAQVIVRARDNANEPMPGVTIATGNDMVAVTNKHGECVLHMKPGSQDIRATLDGFGTVSYLALRVPAGMTMELSISMSPAIEEEIRIDASSLSMPMWPTAPKGLATVRVIWTGLKKDEPRKIVTLVDGQKTDIRPDAFGIATFKPFTNGTIQITINKTLVQIDGAAFAANTLTELRLDPDLYKDLFEAWSQENSGQWRPFTWKQYLDEDGFWAAPRIYKTRPTKS